MTEMNQPPQNNNKGNHVRRRRSSTRIDMTPMVDLAFLLLTFFILTTHFQDPFVMKITMPEESSINNPPPPINSKRVLTLLLGENNTICWYKGEENSKLQRTNFSKIRSILLDQNQKINRMVVLIKASDKSKYQNMVDILDEMTITNINQFYWVDITKAEENLMPRLSLN